MVPKKIMLVEDDAITAMVSEQILKRLGYDIVVASNGQLAVETALAHPSFDLILMDIDLGPGLDGTEAASLILEHQDIPIVFLSSHTEPEVVEKTEKITAYGYVVKHSSPTVLDASIKMAFKLFDANRKLQASELKYQMVFDHSGSSNSIFDTDCRLVMQNKLSRDNLGDLAGEALGKHVSELFGVLTGVLLESRMHRVIQTQLPETFDTEFQLPGGTKWFRSLYQPIINDQQQTVSIQVVSTDITAVIQSEILLRESEAKFRGLVWDMKIGVLLQGPSAEILLSNPKALELLGLSEDQLLGKTSFDPSWNVIREDGSPFPGPEHPVPRAILGRHPILNVVMGVFRPVNADRVWLSVDAIPQLNADGTIRQVICTFLDITMRKQIEEDLTIHQIELSMQNDEFKHSQALLEAMRAKYFELYDLAPVAYITLDGSGHIMESNLAAVSQLGVPRVQLLRQNFTTFIYPDDQDLYYQHRKRLTESGQAQECRLRLKRPDGSGIPVVLKACPAEGEDGSVVFRVGW